MSSSIDKKRWRTKGGESREAWRARWRDPMTGKQEQKTFAKRKEAKAFLENLAAERDQVQGGNVLFADVAQHYLRSVKVGTAGTAPVRSQTLRMYESHERVHIGPLTGGLKFADLDTRTVKRFVEDLLAKPKMTRSNARAIFATFKATIRFAIREDYLKFDPTIGTRIARDPAKAREKVEIPSSNEVRALFQAAEELDDRKFALLFKFLVATGTRSSEARAITFADLSDRTNEVVINKAVSETGEVVPPKSATSNRNIPMPAALVAELLELRRKHQPRDDFVFGTKYNTCISHTNFFNRAWKPMLERAQVKTNIHALRHHFVSSLLERGASIKEAAQLAGHSDATMVLRVYGHLLPEGEARRRSLVESSFDDLFS